MQTPSKARRVLNNLLASSSQVNNPVSIPTAQITTVCDKVSSVEADIKALMSKLKQAFAYSSILGYILDIQLSGGCRISEVLAIKPNQITATGAILIVSAKRGEPRIITTSCSSEFLLNCRLNNISPFHDYNRFWVYREYSKLGIYFQSSTSTKNSVTHAPRHIFTASNRQVTTDQKTLSKAIGQRTQNMSNRYGNKKQD